MDAAHLVDGHLPFFIVRGFLILGKLAQEQVTADLLLLSQAGGINGGQPQQEALLAFEPGVVCLDGVIGDLVVVALVAKCRGKFG